MNPLISVVLTTYNEMPHRLPAAVHSILGQTFQDFELLIYHDGKDSNIGSSFRLTADFVNTFRDINRELPGNMKFLHSEHRRELWGFPMRQDALSQVRGQYVVFQNGDNYATPKYLEFFARSIAENPGVDMVYANVLHNYATPGLEYVVLDTRPGTGAIDMACCCTKIQAAREAGFEPFWVAADGTFVDRLVAQGKHIVKIPHSVTIVHN